MTQRPSRAFYRHDESGQIVVIEKRPDGAIVGSCPVPEPLRDLDAYEVTDRDNVWLSEESDKLILCDAQGAEA